MARRSLTSLEEFVELWRELEFFVGVDVHAKSCHVALQRPDGLAYTWVAPPRPSALIDKLRASGLRIGAIAYEAGPTGFSLAREAKAAGFAVIVAAPSKIPRAVSRGAKTDRLDCRKLANYAARGTLKPIAVPSEKEEAQRTLLRRRHQIVDDLRKVKQRIKSLLPYLGVQEPAGLAHWSAGAVAALPKPPLEPEAKETLASHPRTMKFHQAELKSVEARLATSMEQDHQVVVHCLRSVPGVGAVVASTFRPEMFRPERVARAEEVASYLGLAPIVSQSGAGKARGRIGPVGQKRLRSLPIEAAWIWKAKDPGARATYGRIPSRRGLPQKAITALARRLGMILWRICLERRPYRPCAA